MKDETARFGAWMERTRKRAGLSMIDLELRSGVRQYALSLIARGLREPRISTVMRIVDGLGMRIVFVPKKPKNGDDGDDR